MLGNLNPLRKSIQPDADSSLRETAVLVDGLDRNARVNYPVTQVDQAPGNKSPRATDNAQMQLWLENDDWDQVALARCSR